MPSFHNRTDPSLTAEVELELQRYYEAHPRTPSALRRPRLMRRGCTWIALLGSTLEDGIAGMGNTVASALRAFDARYRGSLKPRN